MWGSCSRNRLLLLGLRKLEKLLHEDSPRGTAWSSGTDTNQLLAEHTGEVRTAQNPLQYRVHHPQQGWELLLLKPVSWASVEDEG